MKPSGGNSRGFPRSLSVITKQSVWHSGQCHRVRQAGIALPSSVLMDTNFHLCATISGKGYMIGWWIYAGDPKNTYGSEPSSPKKVTLGESSRQVAGRNSTKFSAWTFRANRADTWLRGRLASAVPGNTEHRSVCSAISLGEGEEDLTSQEALSRCTPTRASS